MADTTPPFLLTKHVAERLGVNKNTVRQWAKDGRLVPAWRTPGGQARYRSEDVDRFLADQGSAA